MEYKVMGLPALVVNEKVVSVGKVLNLNEAKQILIQQGEE